MPPPLYGARLFRGVGAVAGSVSCSCRQLPFSAWSPSQADEACCSGGLNNGLKAAA